MSAVVVFSSPRAPKEACAHERRGRQLTRLHALTARGSPGCARLEPLERRLTPCASCALLLEILFVVSYLAAFHGGFVFTPMKMMIKDVNKNIKT